MTEPATNLGKKSVLVTGGASGIGLAAAKLLLSRNAAVAVTDRDAKKLAELNIKSERFQAAESDVRDLASLQNAVDLTEQTFGKLTSVVCCAGIQIPGAIDDIDEKDWHTLIDVNLGGVFRTCQAALPALRRAGNSSIVVLASVHAQQSTPARAAYAASKGGLVAMVRAMALDHAKDNIRVNAICPGVVDTPMLSRAKSFSPDSVDWASAQPLMQGIGRICSAEDVAEMIAFLISDSAAYVTGAQFTIDGGLSAQLAL